MLPEALADETGVIFASAFPGVEKLAHESRKFYSYKNLKNQVELLLQVQDMVPSKAKGSFE